jgi:hypothetical protein
MKFRKGLLKIGLLLASISLLLIPSVNTFATSEDTRLNNSFEPVLLKTEHLSYSGEKFDLLEWKATDGTVFYTVSTEVENKDGIAKYVNRYIEKDQNLNRIVPMGARLDWAEEYDKSSGDGRIQWTVRGFSENAIFAPITQSQRVVHDGMILASYQGNGNADKIYLKYSYTFNGVSVNISYPPELEYSGDKVYWEAPAPVTNSWYFSTTTIGAKAESHFPMSQTDISAEANIYKGSYVYRPYIRDTK